MHDVHALAAVAASLENETEKFLDDALITDIKDTPLTTLDGDLLLLMPGASAAMGAHALARTIGAAAQAARHRARCAARRRRDASPSPRVQRRASSSSAASDGPSRSARG